VVAIDRRRLRVRLGGAHLRHFRVAEAVQFQVRQAPIGVAEVGPRRGGRAIRFDGLRNLADRLQGVGEP
jgi:hypothetical protein